MFLFSSCPISYFRATRILDETKFIDSKEKGDSICIYI